MPGQDKTLKEIKKKLKFGETWDHGTLSFRGTSVEKHFSRASTISQI
jgi:hypothetical protein